MTAQQVKEHIDAVVAAGYGHLEVVLWCFDGERINIKSLTVDGPDVSHPQVTLNEVD